EQAGRQIGQPLGSSHDQAAALVPYRDASPTGVVQECYRLHSTSSSSSASSEPGSRGGFCVYRGASRSLSSATLPVEGCLELAPAASAVSAKPPVPFSRAASSGSARSNPASSAVSAELFPAAGGGVRLLWSSSVRGFTS